MDSSRITIGVAGFGNIGRLHVESVSDPQFEGRIAYVRVAESDPRKQEACTVPSSRIDFVSDFRQLTKCDIIIVALPTAMHLEAIRYLCRKTDLLLIEKPLGRTHEESLEIVQLLYQSGQRAMCGLSGLYHPEFQAMYGQLERVGRLTRVSEKLHEAGTHLGHYLRNPQGVLTENGIHTLHRLIRIARQCTPDEKLQITHCELARREFMDAAGEDTATGQLVSDGGAVYDFDVAFHQAAVYENGLPIHYETVVEGEYGVVRVTGWEKCVSTIQGKHTVHYEYPDGPLNGRSQYPRIHHGMQNQMLACLQFLDGTEQLHFTIDEALHTQEMIEACYQWAATRSG